MTQVKAGEGAELGEGDLEAVSGGIGLLPMLIGIKVAHAIIKKWFR